MSDKKSQVVPAGQVSARQRMLQKMADKKNAGLAKYDGKKKASRLVRCSTHPDKGFLLSLYLENDTAHVYEKQPTIINIGPATGAPAEEIKASNVEFENGVTGACMSCSNENWFVCPCGTYSCGERTKNHKCPNCKQVTKTKDMHDYDGMEASAGANRPKGKSRDALPKSGSGLFLGFKR